MRPKGQDIALATIEWYKEEIKNGTKDLYDLGKFLFTVSTGSAALLCTIAKLDASFSVRADLIFALAWYGASIIPSVNLFRPKLMRISGETDLFDLYTDRIQDGAFTFSVWLILWLAGSIIGIYSIIR